MSYLTRPGGIESVEGASPPPEDSGFAGLWPALWEYLSAVVWSDGASREPASLILFVEEGIWKCCLNDKATGRVGWRSAESFNALLDALEAGLASGGMDWRRAKPAPSQRRR